MALRSPFPSEGDFVPPLPTPSKRVVAPSIKPNDGFSWARIQGVAPVPPESTAPGFQLNAFQRGAFQSSVPRDRTIDRDKGGSTDTSVNVAYGPSLGLIRTFIHHVFFISTSGTFVVNPGVSLVVVTNDSDVDLLLPAADAWLNQWFQRPATGFDRSVIIKSGTGSVRIIPRGTDQIDFTNGSITISGLEVTQLYPIVRGWINGSTGIPGPPGSIDNVPDWVNDPPIWIEDPPAWLANPPPATDVTNVWGISGGEWVVIGQEGGGTFAPPIWVVDGPLELGLGPGVYGLNHNNTWTQITLQDTGLPEWINNPPAWITNSPPASDTTNMWVIVGGEWVVGGTIGGGDFAPPIWVVDGPLEQGLGPGIYGLNEQNAWTLIQPGTGDGISLSDVQNWFDTTIVTNPPWAAPEDIPSLMFSSLPEWVINAPSDNVVRGLQNGSWVPITGVGGGTPPAMVDVSPTEPERIPGRLWFDPNEPSTPGISELPDWVQQGSEIASGGVYGLTSDGWVLIPELGQDVTLPFWVNNPPVGDGTFGLTSGGLWQQVQTPGAGFTYTGSGMQGGAIGFDYWGDGPRVWVNGTYRGQLITSQNRLRARLNGNLLQFTDGTRIWSIGSPSSGTWP